jgi:hypothetical protein
LSSSGLSGGVSSSAEELPSSNSSSNQQHSFAVPALPSASTLSNLPSVAEDSFQMDAKVRSQERKKTVEAKVDKKTQAMEALKANRDEKLKRQAEKEKTKRKELEKGKQGRISTFKGLI